MIFFAFLKQNHILKKKVSENALKCKKIHIFEISIVGFRPIIDRNVAEKIRSGLWSCRIVFFRPTPKIDGHYLKKTYPPPPKKKGPFFFGGGGVFN